MIKRLLALVVTSALLLTCATNETKTASGEQYGPIDGAFHGRWWSYYERAVSSMEIGSYTLAEEDLRIALQGRSRDAWSARTYGLHFQEYFPNRELGVLYYKKEQYDEAEQYLKQSLQYVDTERARYYLDLITKARIAKGEINDTTAPTVGAANNVVYTSHFVPLELAANDDVGVSVVKLNGELLPQRGSEKEIVFQRRLVLDEGVHAVNVDSEDLAGKSSSQQVEIVVDLTAPIIGVFEPPVGHIANSNTVKIRGSAVDKHGMSRVTLLDGTVLVSSDSGAQRLDFEGQFPLQAGQNNIVIIAYDTSGNEIRTVVSVMQGRPQSASAKLWRLQQLAPELLVHAMVNTTDLGSGLTDRIDTLLAQAQEGPVRIEFSNPEQPQGKPYPNKELALKGHVISKAPLEILMIKGSEFDPLPTDPAAQPDQFVKTEFERVISLDQGTNILDVRVRDSAGNGASDRLSIEAAPPDAEVPDALRMPLAILEIGGNSPNAEKFGLAAKLGTLLAKEARFSLVERENLAPILQELTISASGLADEKSTLRIGELTAAQFVVMGEIIEASDGFEFLLRVVSTQTGKQFGTEPLDTQIMSKDPTLAQLDEASNKLADLIMKRFPRVSGTMTTGDAKAFSTNLTTNEGVRIGMPVLVLHRVEERDDVTNELLNEIIEPIARGLLTTVSATGSKAQRIRYDGDVEVLERGKSAITW